MKRFLEIEPEFSKYSSSKFIIIPAPYEATTTYGKGTRKGPSAILKASQTVEDYDIELGCEPYKKYGISVLSPLVLTKDPHNTVYKTVKKVLSDKKIPVLLGGEHSVSYGAIKAAKEACDDLSVLQFDAHADLRDSYRGSKYSHACIMRRVREMCPAVQVGIRSADIDEIKYLKDNGLNGNVYYAHSFDDSKINSLAKQLTNDVYITFDVDAFDPSIMPATGTPEPGGLNWYQVLNILRTVISAKNIIGFDVVELSPKPNLHHCEYTIAKLIYKIIGYISNK
ncbi:MAG: agmatinase [Candidatus Saganbacteria bacterium]|nr:agmatinase [Candidatus Saganbacteria bacterium]